MSKPKRKSLAGVYHALYTLAVPCRSPSDPLVPSLKQANCNNCCAPHRRLVLYVLNNARGGCSVSTMRATSTWRPIAATRPARSLPARCGRELQSRGRRIRAGIGSPRSRQSLAESSVRLRLYRYRHPKAAPSVPHGASPRLSRDGSGSDGGGGGCGDGYVKAGGDHHPLRHRKQRAAAVLINALRRDAPLGCGRLELGEKASGSCYLHSSGQHAAFVSRAA
ncbi:hypothetical protein PF008_g325 [Phytophthora fragariae]|uniref:Uncharacterized protein n=1 Tax=Phytophthora fragariae TaxID=53985 RepID=A0A6G0SP57_9STRA|nr:hypothetical protein PF008_g325 [Phytophthora fragariae]